MKSKKEKIVQAALKLFAEEGFKTTSTSNIAKEAGVSEGLIFRHFKNKNGLLEVIQQMADIKIQSIYADIINEEDPKELIRRAIDMGSKLIDSKEDQQIWKLRYKMKWESEDFREFRIFPLQDALENAFRKLGYRKPDLEARLFTMTFDGLATRLFLTDSINLDDYLSYMKTRYQI